MAREVQRPQDWDDYPESAKIDWLRANRSMRDLLEEIVDMSGANRGSLLHTSSSGLTKREMASAALLVEEEAKDE